MVQHNGLLPDGVAPHPASNCRPNWCGLDPITVTAGRPETHLSQRPRDSVANSIAIGRAFRESYDALQARDEGLRELLSYCTVAEQHLAESAVGAPNPAIAEQHNRARWAYADVRNKLAKILDGES